MTYLEFKNYIEKEWLNYLGADTSKAKIRFIPKGYHNCQLSTVNCKFAEAPIQGGCI